MKLPRVDWSGGIPARAPRMMLALQLADRYRPAQQKALREVAVFWKSIIPHEVSESGMLTCEVARNWPI